MSIVNTLETSDDLFNDLDDNMVPEELLQQPNNLDAQVSIWFNEIDVYTSNITGQVHRVSASNINNYIGLYFIIEQPKNGSAGINLLQHHVRILNSYLSKIGFLSFIIGVAHVPSLPSNLTKVNGENLVKGTHDKLSDLLKDQHFDAIIVVFVFFQKLSTFSESKLDLCTTTQIPTLYWRYNHKHKNLNRDDDLWIGIVRLLGGCNNYCIKPGNEDPCYIFEETPAKSVSGELNKCLIKQIRAKNHTCAKLAPEYVLIPVCGNGIVEDAEGCDCLVLAECGSQCDTKCTPKIGSENSAYHYFFLIIAALFILFVIVMSSFYIFVYFKKLSAYEARSSVMSIIPGESKLELSGRKSKVNSNLEAIQINEAKLKSVKKPSKTQLQNI
uniref:Uncharacterized protein n=1 Tax=Tetranychus urticae TaxID=32264 RepID=T1KFA8_TETUR